MNKRNKYILLFFTVVGIIVLINKQLIIDEFIKWNSIKSFTLKNNKWLTDGKVHVVFIGTGSPAPDKNIAQSCIAIIYDNEFIILDAGSSSGRKAEAIGLPMKNFSKAFISHFHSDHIMDLDVWSDISWRSGRQENMKIFGPTGISQIVEGINMTLKQDLSYRNKNIPPSISADKSILVAEEFTPPHNNSMKLIYSNPKNGLKVSVFNVSHKPVEPSVGYRIDVNGKSIVYSGDTKKDKRMIIHAKNADLLIHESYNKAMMNKSLEYSSLIDSSKRDDALLEQIKQTPHYHTDPKEVAEIAKAAGVKQIIYTHIIPSIPKLVPRFISSYIYLKGVGDIYSGKVELAKDGLHITL
jgi:ribonuclease Z